jgi:hypothetical protein
MMEGGKPPAAGAPPSAPSAPGKEPFGGSSASQATPNAGYEAAALQRVGVLVKQVQDLMNLVGATSETGQGLLKALNILVKMVPAGTVNPAAEKNMLEQAQMRNTQNMAQNQQLKQQRMQPPGGAPPPGAGAPPPAMAGA